MIKARENKIQSTDLLVCFPKRAHLSLTHKPICSPCRQSEPNKRPSQNQNLKRINSRPSGSGGANSPVVWGKNKQNRQEVAEPTSPKVTCAGQIKVRPSSSSSGASCKSWQSVMEEIERRHNHRTKDKKKSKWGEHFGFKKADVLSFLTCLRNIRFDFRCFGAFPQADMVSSSDEDEDEFDDEFEIYDEDTQQRNTSRIFTDHNTSNNNDANRNASAVFSKWFMVLQENNNQGKDITLVQNENMLKVNDDSSSPAVPPPNALLLMRCRSAPAKSWLEEKTIEDKQEDEAEQVMVIKEDEQQQKKKRESLAILMKYDADFSKMSSDISQETWVLGGFKDSSFSRSRSWRR